MDGGLYEHYPQYRKYLHNAVTELLGLEISKNIVNRTCKRFMTKKKKNMQKIYDQKKNMQKMDLALELLLAATDSMYDNYF